MRNIFLLICGIFLCVFVSAQTPKKIVIDGGAAPTNTSQLTNDVPFTPRAELIDSLTALEARIETYELTFSGNTGTGLSILNAETFLISGGPGLTTTASGNNLDVNLALNELGTIARGDLNVSTDYLIIERAGTPVAIQLNEFRLSLPNTFTIAPDIGSNADLRLEQTVSFEGGGGIETEWVSGTSTMAFRYDPFANLNPITPTGSKYLTVYDASGNIGRATIATVTGSSTYDWTLRADSGSDAVISNNQIVDVAGGSGISTQMSSDDVIVTLNIDELTEAIPATNDYVVWSDTVDATLRKTRITDLPISSGGGDITSATAFPGGGLVAIGADNGLSGSVEFALSTANLTDQSSSSLNGSDLMILYDNSQSRFEDESIYTVMNDVVRVSGGLTKTGTNGDYFTISGANVTPAWSNITGIPAGFADGVDNTGSTSISNAASTGIILSLSGSTLSADFKTHDLVSWFDGTSRPSNLEPNESYLPVYPNRTFTNSDNTDGTDEDKNNYRMTWTDFLTYSIRAGSNVSLSTDTDGTIAISSSSSGIATIAEGSMIDVSGSGSTRTIDVDLNEASDYISTLSDSDHVIMSTGSGTGNNRKIDFDDFIGDLNENRKAITSTTTSSTSAVFLDEEDECYMSIIADGGVRTLTLPTASSAHIGKKVYVITDERSGGTVQVLGSSRVRVGNNTVTTGSITINDGMFVCMRNPETTSSTSYVWMFIGS